MSDDDAEATREQLLEARLDALEEMLARLSVAYTEMAVVVENVVNSVMEPLDEKAKEAFHNAILTQQKDLRDALRTGLGRDITPTPEHVVPDDSDTST